MAQISWDIRAKKNPRLALGGGVCFFYLMLNRTFFELNSK